MRHASTDPGNGPSFDVRPRGRAPERAQQDRQRAMQLALPVRPGVGAGAVEVRRDRYPELLEPSEQGDALPLQERLVAVKGVRRIERPGLAVSDRQKQIGTTQRWRQVNGIMVGPDLQLRQRVSPNR